MPPEDTREKQFKVSLLDIDKFVSANNIQRITNPIMFKNNHPTSDGLLSNEIFGITTASRSQTFGYIDLGDYFLQPIVYKIWCKVDKLVKPCIHGIGKYKVTSKGELVEDPEGECGLSFLRKNLDKIKFTSNNTLRRDRNIQFLESNKKSGLFFINKLLVIPPFYRDVKTDGQKLSVGDINRLYMNIIISSKAIEESGTYGFQLDETIKSRIQNLLLEVYNWFGSGTDSNPNGGIPSKRGVLRAANMSKTTDYATRLVLSAPSLNVEKMDEMEVDLDYSSLPLASAAANFYPFVIFQMRRFFENQFVGSTHIQDSEGKFYKLGDWRMAFSDSNLKKELDRFIHGYSDRFRRVTVPILIDNKGKEAEKGIYIKGILDDAGKTPLNRPYTWCDVIYRSTVEAVRDKTILITRYPIDSFYNQFPTKIKISSTVTTIPVTIDGQYYPTYPNIREEDIGSNTSTKFKDTMSICNAYLSSIGGDYDGDMVTIKGIFTDEANEELQKQMNSNIHYIDLGCSPILSNSNEAIQSLFSMTLTLESSLLTDPKF